MTKKEKQEKMIKMGIDPNSWIFKATKKELESCICNEWDGKGVSCCGVPCPVHKKPLYRVEPQADLDTTLLEIIEKLNKTIDVVNSLMQEAVKGSGKTETKEFLLDEEKGEL
jgi:hypothetical protein